MRMPHRGGPVAGRGVSASAPPPARNWYFTLELPPDRHGGRQRVRQGGFVTKKAALHARGLLLGTDVNPDPAVVTVGQWLDVWMETKTLAFSTRRVYAQHIRDYLKPYLGNVPLAELNTGRVQTSSPRSSAPDPGRDDRSPAPPCNGSAAFCMPRSTPRSDGNYSPATPRTGSNCHRRGGHVRWCGPTAA